MTSTVDPDPDPDPDPIPLVPEPEGACTSSTNWREGGGWEEGLFDRKRKRRHVFDRECEC